MKINWEVENSLRWVLKDVPGLEEWAGVEGLELCKVSFLNKGHGVKSCSLGRAGCSVHSLSAQRISVVRFEEEGVHATTTSSDSANAFLFDSNVLISQRI